VPSPAPPHVTSASAVVALALVACGNGARASRVPLLYSAAHGLPVIDLPRDAGAPERNDAAPDARVPEVTTPARAAAWPRAKPPAIDGGWCIDRLSALDESTCYLLPDEPTQTLLLYFHGIVPPTRESPQKTKVQTVVANAARRAGVVALLPRGKQGLAPRGHEQWLGWPTTDASYDAYAAGLLAAVSNERRKLEEVAGVHFTRVYVAGSSSGAYFVARIAMRGGIDDAQGFAVISGGAPPIPADLERIAPKPFYFGYGKYEGNTRAAAISLASLLGRAGWPVRTAEHPLDHGAHEIYLDEAFAFWRESAPAPSTMPPVAGRND
jgi:predicted esterase